MDDRIHFEIVTMSCVRVNKKNSNCLLETEKSTRHLSWIKLHYCDHQSPSILFFIWFLCNQNDKSVIQMSVLLQVEKLN